MDTFVFQALTKMKTDSYLPYKKFTSRPKTSILTNNPERILIDRTTEK